MARWGLRAWRLQLRQNLVKVRLILTRCLILKNVLTKSGETFAVFLVLWLFSDSIGKVAALGMRTSYWYVLNPTKAHTGRRDVPFAEDVAKTVLGVGAIMAIRKYPFFAFPTFIVGWDDRAISVCKYLYAGSYPIRSPALVFTAQTSCWDQI